MSGSMALTVYFVIGYVITYLTLETALHFKAREIPYKTIKPYMYKRVKLSNKREMGSKNGGITVLIK